MLDEARFAALWARLNLRGDPRATFEALRDAYADPARAYHTADHITDCLRELDAERGAALHADEVELALWFHDAVYDPRASDNEAQSAAWATTCLAAGDASTDLRQRIQALILATRHESPAVDRDAQLLTDIDLSILGRDPATFAEFERRIRREYAWVPEPQYRAGRREVLARFFARDPLYQTASFGQRYEAAAKRNLRDALDALDAGRELDR